MNHHIKDSLTEYFNTIPGVIAVYLFGSYAEEKEKQTSDIDVGVLFDDETLPAAKEKIVEYTLSLSRQLRKDIHIVILNFAGETLLEQIFKKGICITIKDKKALAHFKMVQYAMIADFAYYKNQMQAGLIRKIMEN